jgi:ABC-type bacteriocin/lantibiotic exporter with double-glycine peptidase domain
LVVALAVVPLAGCTLGSARSVAWPAIEREPGWTLAPGVTLVPQRARLDCGPAALTMLAGRWQPDARIEEVRRQLREVDPGGAEAGHAAGALREVARRRGLQAFLIEGTFRDLEAELQRGRPVLVGLVKPTRGGGRPHYEVVVGLNRTSGHVLTADPERGWRKDTLAGFLSEWQPAGRLALVALGPAARVAQVLEACSPGRPGSCGRLPRGERR